MVKVWNFVKRKEIYKPIFVIWLFLATPSTGSVMFYFMTNKLNFDEEFMGRLRIVSSIASVVGITMYNKWFSHIKFKTIMLWTTMFGILMSLS